MIVLDGGDKGSFNARDTTQGQGVENVILKTFQVNVFFDFFVLVFFM
jgi:hypothetical protein